MQEQRGALILDARSVYDDLRTDSGKLPSDRRLALDLRVLQHCTRSSDWDVRWVCGPQMLSDCFTKGAVDTKYLEWAVGKGTYLLVRDDNLEQRLGQRVSNTKQEVINVVKTAAELRERKSEKNAAKYRNLSTARRAREAVDRRARTGAPRGSLLGRWCTVGPLAGAGLAPKDDDLFPHSSHGVKILHVHRCLLSSFSLFQIQAISSSQNVLVRIIFYARPRCIYSFLKRCRWSPSTREG